MITNDTNEKRRNKTEKWTPEVKGQNESYRNIIDLIK